MTIFHRWMVKPLLVMQPTRYVHTQACQWKSSPASSSCDVAFCICSYILTFLVLSVYISCFLLNLSGRTVALWLNQPLTEMTTVSISWGVKGGQRVVLTTLPSSCAECLEILGVSNSWSPNGLSNLYRDS